MDTERVLGKNALDRCPAPEGDDDSPCPWLLASRNTEDALVVVTLQKVSVTVHVHLDHGEIDDVCQVYDTKPLRSNVVGPGHAGTPRRTGRRFPAHTSVRSRGARPSCTGGRHAGNPPGATRDEVDRKSESRYFSHMFHNYLARRPVVKGILS
jgi:hypothetical protein